MIRVRQSLLVLIFCFSLSGFVNAQKDYSVVKKEIDHLVDSLLTLYKVPGISFEINTPEFSYANTTGLGDIQTGVKRNLNDKIRIGSITKTFVATVILQLTDEGKLKIDDKLSEYYPDYPNSENITLRQVLDMTSGIPDYIDDSAVTKSFFYDRLDKYTPEEIYEITKKMKPYFPPGTAWHYSNGNYNILGMLIEKITGNKVYNEIENRIIKPLGLKNTSFPLTPYMDGQYSHGYMKNNSTGETTDVTVIDPSITWAAGAMISDFDDLKIYSEALVNGSMLSKAAQEERLKFVKTGVVDFLEYGLGIASVGGFIGHNGGITGYNTSMYIHPEMKAQIMVSVNEFGEDGGVSDKIFSAIANKLFPEKNFFKE